MLPALLHEVLNKWVTHKCNSCPKHLITNVDKAIKYSYKNSGRPVGKHNNRADVSHCPFSKCTDWLKPVAEKTKNTLHKLPSRIAPCVRAQIHLIFWFCAAEWNQKTLLKHFMRNLLIFFCPKPKTFISHKELSHYRERISKNKQAVGDSQQSLQLCFLRICILLDEFVAAPLTYARELPAPELCCQANPTKAVIESMEMLRSGTPANCFKPV